MKKYITPKIMTIGLIAVVLLALLFIGSPNRTGMASFYADTLHGKKTASGDVYDRNDYTAAHRELPFGTEVLVTYQETGESVVVEINDRGPHHAGRIIDLSRAAAREIGLIDDGVGEVTIEVL